MILRKMPKRHVIGDGLRQLVFDGAACCTNGDRKPSIILGVIAATQASPLSLPIIILVPEFNDSNGFIQAFAFSMLGETCVPRNGRGEEEHYYGDKLVVMLSSNLPEKKDIEKYILFSADLYDHADNMIGMDFGDNPGPNRFSLPYLSYHKEKNNFGPIVLPMQKHDQYWSSDVANLYLVRSFAATMHDQNKRIITIAISGYPSVMPTVLLSWISSNENSGYAFILIGYKPFLTDLELPPTVISSGYIEFEDVMLFSDFVMTGCGAGSISIPLIYGIPQVCLNREGAQDKKTNNVDIVRVNVGPNLFEMFPKLRNFIDLPIFSSLMESIDRNFESYKHGAHKLKRSVANESIGSISLFFRNLLLCPGLQENCSSSHIGEYLPFDVMKRWNLCMNM